MKEFLQTGSETLLFHPRKRMLATIAAMLCMMALMPLSARAQTQTIVNIVGQQVYITQSSTLYVGEVMLDGHQSFYYLYSEDITQSTTVLGAVKDCLSGFENGQYSYDLVPSLVGATDDVGIATCSNADNEPMMNSVWMNAANAAQACLPNETVISSFSEDLFQTNPDFAAACISDYEGIEVVDNTTGQNVEISGVLGVLSTVHDDNVTYQVINGKLVKVIQRTIYYYCESITVIYTRAELRSLIMETPLTFEAVKAGTINVINPNGLTIEYNKNNAGWTSTSADLISIAVVANDVVEFRGNNSCYWASGDSGETPTRFTATNPCYVYGNVMSLVHANDFASNYTLNDSEALAYLFAAPTNEQYMFYGNNTTLQNHPSNDIMLPATTVPDDGYMYMFAGCQGLTRTPQLPATTIGMGSYHQMFADCVGLVMVPEKLPATTLGLYCYDNMFYGCTSLEVAPVLPATTLAEGCYMGMFNGCTSLNYVKCLATDLGSGTTDYWLTDVAPMGTFVKASDMNDWSVGPYSDDNVDGIPEGWTVKEDMYSMPLTIEIIEANTQLSLSNPEYGAPFEYSYDGVTWIECDTNTTTETTISDPGYKVYFRGNNTKGVHIGTDKHCYVYGNVMSMVTKTDFASCTKITQEYAFYNMFLNGKIMNHPTRELVLPAKKLTASCYSGMFKNCTNLTTAPELPATRLRNNCYSGMFQGCTGLTTAPVLPAITLAEGCYYSMFYGCTALTTAPELPSTALENTCYYWMFYGCTNLESAPKLPATTLKDCCYFGMFIDCTSLTAAPILPATSLVNSCYWAMFNGCTSLNYVKCLATDLGIGNTNYWLADVAASGTFVKAAGMTDWTTGEDGIPEGWTVENIDVFTTDGNWDVADHWSGNTVPADGSDVAVVANAVIPSGVTVHADDIDLYGTLTITDGGQLYHNNEGVTATVQKNIMAYTIEQTNGEEKSNGWYLLASPMQEAVEPSETILSNSFDLYGFNQSEELEWRNYHQYSNFMLNNGQGCLYANSGDGEQPAMTIELEGQLRPSGVNVEVPLVYDANASFPGWNLVGNPFVCDAYLAEPHDFYVMNAAGDDLEISENEIIAPLQGLFVQATNANDSLLSFTATLPQSKNRGGALLLNVYKGDSSRSEGVVVDRARVRFGKGPALDKFRLRPNSTMVFIPQDGHDYAVMYASKEGEVLVNFKAAESGSYTISVNPEKVEMRYLHLIDNITGADIDLLRTPTYTFEAKVSDYASRFKLVFSANDAVNNDMGEDFTLIRNGQLIKRTVY